MNTPSENIRVLVVEDQIDILNFIANTLRRDGWQILTASSIANAQEQLSKNPPHMMLIDLSLPDGDGQNLIINVRQWSDMSIIVVSARDQEADKIKALNNGADDYLTKPFSINELLARARAQIRAQSRRFSAQRVDEVEPVVRFGSVVWDRQKNHLTRAGEAVHLTQTETQLLAHLVAHTGEVLTHKQLLKQIWGSALDENAHYLRIYMSHLRKKLEDNPTQPQHLLTETGVGYRFVIE